MISFCLIVFVIMSIRSLIICIKHYEFLLLIIAILTTYIYLYSHLQVFNNSPDETAFYSLILYRADVLSSMTMIQPSLTSYTMNQFNNSEDINNSTNNSLLGRPVLLDVAAVTPDSILVLDAFFSVVLFHGHTVAQWRDAGNVEAWRESIETVVYLNLLVLVLRCKVDYGGLVTHRP